MDPREKREGQGSALWTLGISADIAVQRFISSHLGNSESSEEKTRSTRPKCRNTRWVGHCRVRSSNNPEKLICSIPGARRCSAALKNNQMNEIMRLNCMPGPGFDCARADGRAPRAPSLPPQA